jgi:ABC-type multidrug transport system ATPase subunit/ABC-type multidrug transport system permease subunit
VLVTRDVEVSVADGVHILGPVSLQVAPGTLTALMGASGSGKSTLMRVLSGVILPTAGAADWGGETAAAAVHALGYVPQRESVHDRLTVREAMSYAASLRLQPGAPVAQRVASTLSELGLVEQADRMIQNLSGGERRRAACGVELVGDPPALLLDEPTSGLDLELERRLMMTFRKLADQGRVVIVATHATTSLDLCDEVIYMQSGRVAWQAGPAEAQENLARVVADLGRRERRETVVQMPPAGSLTATPVPASPPDRAGAPAAPVGDAASAAEPPPRRPFAFEVHILASRYLRTVTRDRRGLMLLVAQAPILGLLIAVIFHAGVLSSPASPIAAIELVFLLMTSSIWIGVTSSTREVVKERGLVEREFDVGVRLDAYVTAKALVLFALNLVQAVLLVVVVVALQPLGIGGRGVDQLFLLAVLTAWAATSLGLAVSCLARTTDQAAGAVPLLLMPQLLLAGGLIPLAQMPAAISALSNVVFARWSYAGMATAAHVGSRLDQAAYPGNLGYSSSFFTLRFGVAVAALAGFSLAGLIAAVLCLMRRAPLS